MAERETVEMVFKATDNVSGPMAKAEAQLKKTGAAASEATERQNTAILKSVETLSAMHALQSGLSAITTSVKTLGLVDEETYATLQQVTAGIQLVVGTAEAVKGVVTLFQSLNAVLKTTAVVSTFASIAENPAMGLAIVGAGGLAVGALTGYMAGSTNNTTINVAHESAARTTQTVVDAGAWY